VVASAKAQTSRPETRSDLRGKSLIGTAPIQRQEPLSRRLFFKTAISTEK
jgi:hypothetical protein